MGYIFIPVIIFLHRFNKLLTPSQSSTYGMLTTQQLGAQLIASEIGGISFGSLVLALVTTSIRRNLYLLLRSNTPRKLNPPLTARESKSPPLEVGTWVRLSVTTHSRKSSFVRKLANGHLSWRDWRTLQPHNHRLLTLP